MLGMTSAKNDSKYIFDRNIQIYINIEEICLVYVHYDIIYYF